MDLILLRGSGPTDIFKMVLIDYLASEKSIGTLRMVWKIVFCSNFCKKLVFFEIFFVKDF